MPDVLLSTTVLLDRLGREEQQLKQIGLHGHAAGVRAAITVILRLADHADQPAQPIDPST